MPRENQKRQVICNVAAQLFVEKGFEKTTIRDIAKAGKMNSAALYYYFEDKEEILYDTLIRIMDDSLEQLIEINNNAIPLKEKLIEVIRLHTRVYGVDTVSGSLIVYNQKSLNPEHWEELRLKQAQYARIVTSIIDGLKQQETLGDIDTTVSAFALFGMIQWAHLWYNPEGRVTPAELEEAFIRIFMGGVSRD